MKTYRIRDWDKHYETAETRKLVSLRWLPIPNKHDGLGFRRIAAQKDASELFTAWILILQVASKGRGPEERGNLLRGQEALGDEDLAMMTGFPRAIFTRALDFFANPKQGWLLVNEDELPLSAGTPAESPASPASSPAVWNGMEGIEGNGNNTLPKPAAPVGAEVEAIWRAYPRKVGKTKAVAIIKSLLGKNPPSFASELLGKVTAYAAAVKLWPPGNEQFVPHPATWFSQGRYEDDPDTWTRSQVGRNEPRRMNFA